MVALHPAILRLPSVKQPGGARTNTILLCIVASILFSQTVYCQSQSQYGQFLYPGLTQGGHQYNYKDVVLVSWYSTIPNPILTTWARPAGSHLQVANYAQANVPSNGAWPLSFQSRIDNGTWTTFPVQLHMNIHDEEKHGFNGVSFQVTSDPAKAATTFAYQFTMGVTTPTVLPTTAPTLSPPPVAPTSTTDAPQRTAPAFSTESAPPPPPPQPSVLPPSSNGLSTGAKVGIGLGVGFGALIILGVAAVMFAIYRRRLRDRPKELYTEKDISPMETTANAARMDGFRIDTGEVYTARTEADAGEDEAVRKDYFATELHAEAARHEVAG